MIIITLIRGTNSFCYRERRNSLCENVSRDITLFWICTNLPPNTEESALPRHIKAGKKNLVGFALAAMNGQPYRRVL